MHEAAECLPLAEGVRLGTAAYRRINLVQRSGTPRSARKKASGTTTLTTGST